MIYTDSSVNLVSDRAGCGFFVACDNFRYGLALQTFTSSLSSELYAIFRAIHYFSRAGIGKVLIVSDSLAALSSLRDQLVGFVKSLLVFGIAHLLACAEENNRIVEFLWVPAHADIRSSGVADEVTRLVGRLSYQVQFGLPYVDLLDPIRGDCDA